MADTVLHEACVAFKGMLRDLVAATSSAGHRLSSEAYGARLAGPTRTRTLTRCGALRVGQGPMLRVVGGGSGLPRPGHARHGVLPGPG
jgi:hypothetical protein